jgi:hypothetical protein
MKYVNTYRTGKAYGGPEEGGWWYTYGAMLTSQRVTSLKTARRIARRILRRLDKQNAEEGNREPDSVLNQGEWLDVIIEDNPAANFPESRPYYE